MKKLNEFTQKNLDIIQNFILHLTHRSPGDYNFKEEFNISAETMYQGAREYIEEDHVDGMEREDAPEDKYQVVTATTAAELNRKVANLQDAGWCTDGPHQVVCKESFDTYAGKEHRAVKYIYEYSQTLTH